MIVSHGGNTKASTSVKTNNALTSMKQNHEASLSLSNFRPRIAVANSDTEITIHAGQSADHTPENISTSLSSLYTNTPSTFFSNARLTAIKEITIIHKNINLALIAAFSLFCCFFQPYLLFTFQTLISCFNNFFNCRIKSIFLRVKRFK